MTAKCQEKTNKLYLSERIRVVGWGWSAKSWSGRCLQGTGCSNETCETLNMNASGEELPECKTPVAGGSMLVRGTGKKQLNGHILWD